MKTLSVRLSPAAQADLAEVAWWLEEQGVAARAIRGYLARMRRRYVRIGRVPYGGEPLENFGSAIRRAVFEHSATILYRVEPERVLILRILRRGRDAETAARS